LGFSSSFDFLFVQVVCEFDWEFDELQEFVDKLVEEEALPAEQADEFKVRVRCNVTVSF
jgi:hypothetical protein